MKAKYPAKCRYCGLAIEVGRDEYDLESKSSYHLECEENQPPSGEDFAKAERLGFCKTEDIARYAPGWVSGDGLVRDLLKATSSDPAWRVEPDAPGRDSLLFE